MPENNTLENSPPENLAINVRGLCKNFGDKKAVNKVDLRVRRGEVFGFLGPNGSGKTTTIRMICGLLTPDAGEGSCLGFDVMSQSSEIKKHVGYMTQKFSLYEDLTIEENLLFVARMYGGKNPKEMSAKTIDDLGLTSRKKELAGALSGGWKQRLSLAACIMHDPKLLLLDEPTAGVDPKARRAFWDEIHQLAAKGVTILVSTHYMDEAERCHRLAYLSYGEMLAHGTPQDLVDQSHLITWRVEGDDLQDLTHQLLARPGVETAAPFGSRLHVSGANKAALEHAISPFRAKSPNSWRQIKPNLEDVFIHFMLEAKDNVSHEEIE